MCFESTNCQSFQKDEMLMYIMKIEVMMMKMKYSDSQVVFKGYLWPWKQYFNFILHLYILHSCLHSSGM